MLDDSQVLYELKKGSENSFDLLFARYYAELVYYAFSFTSDRNISEDLVQDFFVKFWVQKKYNNVSSSLRHYLFFSIRNACINYLRDNKLCVNFENLEFELVENEADSDTEEKEEIYKKIIKSVDKLPVERKKIFTLCYFHNMKYKEVADLLDISINTVKVQIGRALKFIRENSFFL